jgi:hypothetical protein
LIQLLAVAEAVDHPGPHRGGVAGIGVRHAIDGTAYGGMIA